MASAVMARMSNVYGRGERPYDVTHPVDDVISQRRLYLSLEPLRSVRLPVRLLRTDYLRKHYDNG